LPALGRPKLTESKWLTVMQDSVDRSVARQVSVGRPVDRKTCTQICTGCQNCGWSVGRPDQAKRQNKTEFWRRRRFL